MEIKAPPLTVEEYHRLCETGAIAYDARTELIRGQIYPMIAKGTPHTICCRNFLKLLPPLLAEDELLQCQDPIRLPNASEPEPDIAIIRTREDNYSDGHPEPADIVLLVEVADSSLAFDRDVKLPLYAEYGIEVVWLVNLQDDRLEVHQQPGQSKGKFIYQNREFYGRGEFVEFGGRAIAINKILP
ncbi:MAG: Uma2 family endonuclease [Cyanobacteria bacterium P01_D01_bin.73]